MGSVTETSAAGPAYPLDSFGFLADPTLWDTAYVEETAGRAGVTGRLSILHWKVILFVRKSFVSRGEIPRVATACHHCGLPLKKLHQLFPSGYLRGVCRLAGIPYNTIATVHNALTYETIPPLES